MGPDSAVVDLRFTATIARHFDLVAIVLGPLEFTIFEVDHDEPAISSKISTPAEKTLRRLEKREVAEP